MSNWKFSELVAPAHLSARDTAIRLNDQVRLNATEAGDFVQEIRIEAIGLPHDGWQKWRVAYRPGPPAPFPRLPRTLPSADGGPVASS